MSVVAIRKIEKGKFEIAADSIYVRGWTQGKDPNVKLWKVGDMIAGSAGRMAVSGLFREYIENHRPKSNSEWGWVNFMSDFICYATKIDSKLSSDDNEFIVVWKKKAFFLVGMSVQEIKTFFAIGAGTEYALTALHLGHSAKEAVNVACELSIYCEKPIKVFLV